MTPRARARLVSVVVVVLGLALATGFALYGLSGKITYFHTPSELATLTPRQLDRTIRLGGMVRDERQDGETHIFTVADNTAQVAVAYRGILPDLFRVGQGVVVYGKYDAAAKTFNAREVLAKHDENYMPPEVKKALEKPTAEKQP